jgi:hypothetical protein
MSMMKSATFGLGTEEFAAEFFLLGGEFNPWLLGSNSEAAGREAVLSYRRSRENGVPSDQPSSNFPEDGTLTWHERTDGKYQVKYTEGPGDREWMAQCDRNYLARLERAEQEVNGENELAAQLREVQEKLEREQQLKEEVAEQTAGRENELVVQLQEAQEKFERERQLKEEAAEQATGRENKLMAQLHEAQEKLKREQQRKRLETAKRSSPTRDDDKIADSTASSSSLPTKSGGDCAQHVLIPPTPGSATAAMTTHTSTCSQVNDKLYDITQLFTVKKPQGVPIGSVIGLRNKVIHHSFRTFLEECLLPYCQQKSDFFKSVTQRLQITQLRLFVSYAWAMPDHADYATQRAHEVYVQKIAKDLACAGFHIYLDRKEDRAGRVLTKFIEKMELADHNTPTSNSMARTASKSDYILPICTPLYLWKYLRREELFNTPDKVVRFEVMILNHIVRYNEKQQERIVPLLLAGTEKASVPFLLQTQIAAYFTQQDYHANFFKLVKSLYRLSPEDTGFKQLEKEFYATRRKLATMDLTEIEQNHAEQAARQAISSYRTKQKYKQHDLLASYGTIVNTSPAMSSQEVHDEEEQQLAAKSSDRHP